MSTDATVETRIPAGWAVLLMLPAVPLNGWATMLIWRWFGCHMLHLPPLNFAQSLAAYYLAIWFQRLPKRDREPGIAALDVGTAYLAPILSVATSWILYLFIR